MDYYGKRIKALRVAQGLTQAELGKQLNVTSQAVSKWENDLSEPDLESTKRMCKIFHITIDELLDTKTPLDTSKHLVDNDKDDSIQPTVDTVQPKIISGYCIACNKPVAPGEYHVENLGNRQNIYCNNCWNQKLLRDKKRTYNEHSNQIKKSFIWGSIVGIVVFLITLISCISVSYFPGIAISFVLGISFFTFISQMFWDGAVFDLFTFFLKSFNMPGIIFSFDLDGLKFLIIMKLVFAILSVALSVLSFFIGLIISLFVSIFTFPFATRRVFKERKNFSM